MAVFINTLNINIKKINKMAEKTNQKTSGTIQKPPQAGKPLTPLRVGIICTETNVEDLIDYKEEFISINKKLGKKVELVFIGYSVNDNQENLLDGISFEYVKPMSIVHYFKQLSSLDLDVVFIPLLKTQHNVTSEDYNKFLEAGLFKIPIISVGIYPYQKIISDKINGFLYQEKHELVPLLDHLYIQRKLVEQVGRNAYEDVTTEFNYSPKHIKLISDLFIK